jgi:hypothetical protein
LSHTPQRIAAFLPANKSSSVKQRRSPENDDKSISKGVITDKVDKGGWENVILSAVEGS